MTTANAKFKNFVFKYEYSFSTLNLSWRLLISPSLSLPLPLIVNKRHFFLQVSENDDVQKLQSQIEKLENGRNSADIMEPGEEEENAEDMKENEAPVYVSDKKTDELKGKSDTFSLHFLSLSIMVYVERLNSFLHNHNQVN